MTREALKLVLSIAFRYLSWIVLLTRTKVDDLIVSELKKLAEDDSFLDMLLDILKKRAGPAAALLLALLLPAGAAPAADADLRAKVALALAAAKADAGNCACDVGGPCSCKPDACRCDDCGCDACPGKAGDVKAAAAKAAREGKVLALWVGRRDAAAEAVLAECVHVVVAEYQGDATPRVVVGVPYGPDVYTAGTVARGGAFAPSQVTDAAKAYRARWEIKARAATPRPPAPAFTPVFAPAFRAGGGGC
jgi:hypothetical protein